MRTHLGSLNRILELDLTRMVSVAFEVSDTDRTLYLGGKGLGLKLIYDRQPPGADPLGPDNMVAIMPGVLSGTGAPCSGRFAALTKSPLTGLMLSSSCGGPFGIALKTAGWGGLLIKGEAAGPTIVEIDESGATFLDGAHLWGKDTVHTRRELGEGKNRGVLTIGPAGENLVRFANVASGDRFFGRGGLGAVMGAKKLKAIAATGGTVAIGPADPEAFKKAKKRALAYIRSNPWTSREFTRFGTAVNLKTTNEAGILPVNNFSAGSHPDAAKITGEAIAENHETRHHTCKPCSILCGHTGTFGGRVMPAPEYETLGLMGSNLGIFDPEAIAGLNRIAAEEGMDTISAGGVLGWAMEAGEKGIFPTALRFGDADGAALLLRDIAAKKDLGGDLAEGVKRVSEKYGGEAFAVHVKGLEMSAYDPRGAVGHGLAYAVANRGGCHLSAFVVGLEIFFRLLNPRSTRAKPEFTRFLESLTSAVNSLQTCMFTTFAYLFEAPLTKYTPRPLLALLMQYLPGAAIALTDVGLYPMLWSSVTGMPLSSRKFMEAGDRITVLERHMNVREGLTGEMDTLPPRILNEGGGVPLDKMVPAYYSLRGYDRQGIPEGKTLSALGISAPGGGKASTPGTPHLLMSNRLKKLWVIAGAFLMGRTFQSASARDPEIQRELETLPEGFSAAIEVEPGVLKAVFVKTGGKMSFRGLKGGPTDLTMTFTSLESAFMVFSAQMGPVTAFARHRVRLSGDLAAAMALIRCINIVEAYLFPRFILKKILKRPPEMGMKRQLWRIRAYLLGIPFGL